MVVGIEVAEPTLDVGIHPSPDRWHVPYPEAGVAALAAAALPVGVGTPREARDFATALGHLAKTDALDAAGLAHFAAAVPPAIGPVADAATPHLAALGTPRRHFIAMRTAAQNRLATTPTALRTEVRAHLRWLERRRAGLDTDLDQAIRAHPGGRPQTDLRRRVPGVGPIVARTRLAELPERGTLSPKAGAALAGSAPLSRDSGLFRGRRRVGGGRAAVRAVLSQGGSGRRPIPPGAPCLLRAPAGGGKGAPSRLAGLDVPAPPDPARDGHTSATVDPDSCRDASKTLLTGHTIALRRLKV